MAGEFVFPNEIEYEGMHWHLLYSPTDPKTIAPSLDGAQILSVSCDPVTVAGRDQPIYLAMIHILFPAKQDMSGRVVGERRLLGFRTYAYVQPNFNLNNIKPNECVFYMANLQGMAASAAQRFFDAVTGANHPVQEPVDKVDASWCQDLRGGNEQGNRQNNQQCTEPSDTVSEGQ